LSFFIKKENSFLASRGNSFTFFAGKKVSKNLVIQKTRFTIRSFVWFSGLPKAYLYFAHPAFSSFRRKKQAEGVLKQFWATVLSAKNDFKKFLCRVSWCFRN